MTQKFKTGVVFESTIKAPDPTTADGVATKQSAQAQADTAQSNATATAAADATTKANSAQAAAISAAATDATTKANTAQSNAISAAAADATSKANTAQTNAAAYTDGVRQGMFPKANVKAATTAALPAVTATVTTLTANAFGVFPTQDGITIGLNETLLVKNQANPAQNGPYKITTAGTAGAAFVLTRTDDFDTSAEALSGSYLGVQQGATYADQMWQMITDITPFTLGTTSQTWQQFVTASTVTASTGLTKVGNDIQAVPTANRTAITAGAIDVAPALLPSPLAGDASKVLQATGANTAAWTTPPVATDAVAGYLSAADHTSLTRVGGIIPVAPTSQLFEQRAIVNPSTQAIAYEAIPVATDSVQGEMSAADHTKFSAIAPVVFSGTLADNQAAPARVDAGSVLGYLFAAANGAIFDVTVRRGANVMVGRLLVASLTDNSVAPSLGSFFEELGLVGVSFSVSAVAGKNELFYTTTSTGVAAQIKVNRVLMLP